ncbi:577_t:CDS:2, partial [Rhizophagus irregularis]
LKARLQFHRSEPRAKTLKMEPFSEGLFIILFYNKSTFQYSPAQRKYICKFKDSDTQLRCGSMRFEFNVDVRDYVEEYPEKLVKKFDNATKNQFI